MLAWMVWDCLVQFKNFWCLWLVDMKWKEEQLGVCGCRKDERQSVEENVKKKKKGMENRDKKENLVEWGKGKTEIMERWDGKGGKK